jgi:hypothetical protein
VINVVAKRLLCASGKVWAFSDESGIDPILIKRQHLIDPHRVDQGAGALPLF